MTVPGGLLTQPLGPPSGGPAAPVAPPMPVMAQGGPDDSAYEQGGANPNILDKILNRVMPTTQAYKGLLTPEQVSGARRQGLMQMGLSMLANSGPVDGRPAMSTAQALGVGGMQGLGAYQGAQQQALAQQQEAIQMHQNQRIIQARAAIAQQFAPVQGETQQQQLQRLANASAASYGAGDVQGGEGYAKTAEALKATRYSMGMLPGQMGGAGSERLVTLADGSMARVNMLTGDMTPISDAQGNPAKSAAITPAERAAKEAGAAARAGVAAGNSAQSHDMAYLNSFKSSQAITPFLQRAPILGRVIGVVNGVNSSDPDIRKAAMSSLPGAVASLEPQKPVLRAQLYEYMKTVDQSLRGKLEAAFESTGWGDLPADQQQMLQKFVTQTAKTEQANYKRQYDASLAAAPTPGAKSLMAQYAPEVLYGGATPATPIPSGAGKTKTTTSAKAGGAATAVAKPASYSKDNPFAQAPPS